MNSYGLCFRITTFGESHGEAIGVVIDGCPAGLGIDTSFIQSELDRRRPGQSPIASPRKEHDTCKILSGVFQGQSTGTPIALVVGNNDHRSQDYDHLATAFRPSHADYTYEAKYGLRDHRGGGRSSARETVARVAAGAVAKLFLRTVPIDITAYVSQIGHLHAPPYTALDLSTRDDTHVRCPDANIAHQMMSLIQEVMDEGDTIGGVVTCVLRNVPAGIGEPVFGKLHAELGRAMLSINAVKGFEYGSGFSGAAMRGSEHNDAFERDGNAMRTRTNRSGGIQGGISNGEDIYFNVAFKPVATLMQDQRSLDNQGNVVTLPGKGRHDPCVVPRAVPIVEAMAALTLADLLLQQRSSKI